MTGVASGTPFPLSGIVIRDDGGVLRLPLLIKGKLIYAREVAAGTLHAAAAAAAASMPARLGGSFGFRLDGLQVLREPVLDPATLGPTGEARFLVFPRPDPGQLIERDPAERARTLHNLPFDDVLEFASALRDVLVAGRSAIAEAVRDLDTGSIVDPRLVKLLMDILPALLDPAALAEAADCEMALGGIPGRQFLDGWVTVPGAAHRGMMSRLGDHLFPAGGETRPAFSPRVRAVPSRQLHITAGNSPLVPFLSFVRGLLTKGSCTIKSASEATGIAAILAVGLHALGPDHPITRHTSLVYWQGGDREIEDALFAPGAYDRVIVWGSQETVRSVRQRVLHAKSIVLASRYGVSLIGREAREHLEKTAQAASVDSLIWDQKACTASLVHYVEGDENSALAYCKALQKALARWDALLPRPLPLAVQGKLRLLKRGPLMSGTWFENGQPPDLRSAVVLMPVPFDLSMHPMSRFVVVRPVHRLEEALPWIGPAVSAAGVFPRRALFEFRDLLAAAGVSNVFPLGECERAWPGMPHDGMRILAELMNWTSSGGGSGAEE